MSEQNNPKFNEILEDTWGIFKPNLKSIAIITAVVYIPVNFILNLVNLNSPTIPDNATTTEILNSIKQQMRVGQLLEGTLGLIGTFALYYIILKAQQKKNIDPLKALKEGLNKFFGGFLVNLNLGVRLLLLLIALIIPGLVFAVFWAFALQAYFFRQKTGYDALIYSKSLVKGRWWHVFQIQISIWILSFITGLILGLPYIFLPENLGINIIYDTFIDLSFMFFLTAQVIYFFKLEKTLPKNKPALEPTPAPPKKESKQTKEVASK